MNSRVAKSFRIAEEIKQRAEMNLWPLPSYFLIKRETDAGMVGCWHGGILGVAVSPAKSFQRPGH